MTFRPRVFATLSLALVLSVAVPAAHAQIATSPKTPATAVVPPAPEPPSVINRDAEGRVTVRATRLSEPIVIDGRLDEEVYARVPSFGDFVEQDPHEGRPAENKSEVWVFFDDQNVYVSLRFWHAQPDTIVANEMRRDGQPIFSTNDNVGITFDTFLDHRSGYYVNTNALGALRDALIMDENRNYSLDFNLVWNVRSRRFDRGWTSEIVVPFKSLRYPAGRHQVWGFNVQRIDRGMNVFSYLTPMPISYGGWGIWKPSMEATLVGIEAPAGGGRFEVKPYALSSVTMDRQASPPIPNDLDAAFGFDAKYKVTRSLNADVTYNTDFAQVEVDNQQINLTRFNLFYPEKRDFFLEGQTTFGFGGSGGTSTGTIPNIFFSRRIGLTTDGAPVPIAAGGRVMGRLGAYTVGLMSIRTKEAQDAGAAATSHSVVRLRRDVAGHSGIGLIATDRSPSASAGGSNQVIGADANLALFQNVEVIAYYARSRTQGRSGDETSYRGQFRYAGDRYGTEFDRTKVGESFNPEIGFLPRPDYVRTYGFGRFSPRPKQMRLVRRFSWEGWVENIAASSTGALQTRTVGGEFRLYAENGDEFDVIRTQTDDRPLRAFSVAGASIPAGSYSLGETKFNYVFGPQQPLSGTLSFARGSYYGGRKTEASYNGRVAPTSRFMVEPILTFDWLAMPTGDFTARLVSARTTFTMSPRMMVAALIQYNSTADRLGMNIRFRWEYQPGSDFYLVYGDGRDTSVRGFPEPLNRSFSVKFTRLLRS